jgi:hypothetical protein
MVHKENGYKTLLLRSVLFGVLALMNTLNIIRGHRDRIVVGFTTTYAISAYHR